MSASVAVVHTAGLASGAPDPVDRQLLRKVLALAGAVPVTLACAEPHTGPRRTPELDAAGVEVVEVAATVERWLIEHPAITTVVATSLPLAERVRCARPDATLVLDLASLPAAAYERAVRDVEVVEHEGAATVLDHVRSRDLDLLHHAAVVLVPHDDLAETVLELAPGADVRVVAPPVPVAAARTPPRGRRIGVVGRFASEPGLPAEAALSATLDASAALAAEVVAVGLDASVLRRALASRVAACPPPADLAPATRGLRAVVVPAHDPALVAELCGLGVPHVVHDPDDPHGLAHALAPLLDDDTDWLDAHRRVRAVAAAHLAPSHAAAAFLDALRVASPPQSGAPVAAVDPPPTWERRSVAGSLAAQTPVSEQLRREAQPDAIVPWQHALYTNLDLAPDVAYRRWLRVHHDVGPRRDVLAARAARIAPAPRLSVVMPVHDTDPVVLRAAIASVRAQIWPHWQLCIADDGSTSTATRAVLDALAGDERVIVHRSDTAQGISAATNRAISHATGDLVVFLDHDDVLADDALFWVARAVDLHPDADIVYSDEDKLDVSGERVEPFCKPDWSPDLLLSCNYITHLLAVRRSLLDRIGGLRPELDGAQDYDLLLRLTELTDRVVHVPKPLYSWRKSAGSTAADIGAKPHAHAASRRALDEALIRRGLEAERTPGIDPTWHRVRYRITARPLVTVVIPTRDRLDLLGPCIDLLRANVAHDPLEILVVDNESSDPDTLRYLDDLDGRVVRYPHRFNYARQMNLAALEARGEVLLLLNNDARPVGHQWFDALLEHALRPEVGAVGARLRFPDGRAQHEGVVLNAGGVALNLDAGPYAVLSESVRDTAAVTGACLMVRRSAWHAVGGMDERLRVAYNDVDLCLRLGERGWRTIYTPLAELAHAESSSRGSLHPEVDEAFYQHRWGAPRTCADPFFTTAIELLAPFSPRL